jgi:hypothetical protein
MEVTTAGTKFTWRGPQWNGRDRVLKKLDRVLCNVSWRLRFQEGFAKVLPRVQSDHHPIIVIHDGETNAGTNRPFRYEAAWATHENFRQLLQENWIRGRDFVDLLSNLTNNLKVWNKEVFGNIFKRKKELLARLNGIQNSPNYGYSNFLENLKTSFNTNSQLLYIKRNVFGTKNQEGSGLLMVTVIQSTTILRQSSEDAATRLFPFGVGRENGLRTKKLLVIWQQISISTYTMKTSPFVIQLSRGRLTLRILKPITTS